MNVANTITGLEPPAGSWREQGVACDDSPTIMNAPQPTLQSALLVLGDGNVPQAPKRLSDHFTFQRPGT